MARASASWRAGRDDVVVGDDDDRGRHVDPAEPRAASGAGRGRRAPGRPPTGWCSRNSRERPLLDVGRLEVERRRRPRARRAPPCATGRSPRGAEHGAPMPVKNSRSARRHLEPVGGRAQHQALDLVAVLAPDPLGDDRAHRVAGDDRRPRARARRSARPRRRRSRTARTPRCWMPWPCQRRSRVTTRNRRESGSIAGYQVSSPVQPSACSSTIVGESGSGPGVSVTYVVPPRPGSSTIRPGGIRAHGM